jgi:hypothetical protein
MKPQVTRPRLAAAASLLFLAACSLGAAGYGDAVDGFECDATGQEPIRAVVSVHLVTDAIRLGATGGVGSSGSCNYLVRTENEEGFVIVRGDDAAHATLGTFLTIWEYAIPQGSGGASAFREAATSGEIRVNGEAVAGGPDDVPLRDGVVIELIAP